MRVGDTGGFKRVRTCSNFFFFFKSCTRVGRMGRMREDGLGCGKVDSGCEDGKGRVQRSDDSRQGLRG